MTILQSGQTTFNDAQWPTALPNLDERQTSCLDNAVKLARRSFLSIGTDLISSQLMVVLAIMSVIIRWRFWSVLTQ